MFVCLVGDEYVYSIHGWSIGHDSLPRRFAIVYTWFLASSLYMNVQYSSHCLLLVSCCRRSPPCDSHSQRDGTADWHTARGARDGQVELQSTVDISVCLHARSQVPLCSLEKS